MLPFYKNMLLSWGRFNRNDTIKIDEPLFFNDHFTKPDGKCLDYKNIIERGITNLGQIFQNDHFLNFEEVKGLYSLRNSDYISYMSIIQCVAKYKDAYRNVILEPSPRPCATLKSKTVMKKLRTRYNEEPTSEIFFTQIFNIDANLWAKIYSLPFAVTIENKLRSFQFKVNHNIYYTNEKMAKANMEIIEIKDGKEVPTKVTPTCSFCNEAVETLIHLFVECPMVNHLWLCVENDLSISFGKSEKILGFYEHLDNRVFDIYSHITIIVKYYIHICRLKRSKLCYKVLVKQIASVETIEHRIAYKRGKLKQHSEKWATVIEKFSL